MSEAIRYGTGVPGDYPQILALNESAIPAVNRIEEKDLRQLHRQSEILLVARAGEALAGFLLALNEHAEYESINYQYFRRRYSRFAYVDRIVVSESFRRMGIGAGLYEALFEATGHLPRIACEVNVKPANPASMHFHGRLGFSVVAEQDTEGGSKRVALMVRERQAQEQTAGKHAFRQRS